MGRNPKLVRTTYNIQSTLTDIIKHGHMYGIFGHFGFHYIDGGSILTSSSISLCLRMLHDSVVDEFGNLLYENGSSMHPLHDTLIKNKFNGKFQEYKSVVM